MEPRDPWMILNLPDPASITLEDSALRTTYREYCECLSLDPNGRFIRSDGLFFHFADFGSLFENGDYSRLQLLQALYHPNKTQLSFIRRRLSDSIRYENAKGQFNGHVLDFNELDYFRRFIGFRDSADYAALTRSTADARTLGRAENEHPAWLGGTFLSELHASRYTRQWAIVLWFGDAEDNRVYAFPTILGYVRTDDLERNIVALMTDEILFRAPSPLVRTRGFSDLVALAWFMDSDAELASDKYYNYAEFFSQFSNSELALFRQEYGGLLHSRVLREKVFSFLCKYGDTFDLNHVSNECGRPSGPGYLNDLEQWLEMKNERIESEQEEEDNRWRMHIQNLEEYAQPFEEEIEDLLAAIVGPKPKQRCNLTRAKRYYHKWSSLRLRILEHLWRNKCLPTISDLDAR